MAVAAQTFSRTNLREFAFTTDHVRAETIDTVFSHSPALMIFGQQSLGDFGGTPLRGSGHNVVPGGHSVQTHVSLGEHAGTSRAAGPFSTHNVSPDDNVRIGTSNWAFYNHGLAVSTHDLRINRGDVARANFLEFQTQQVMKAVANTLASDLLSTASPANAVTSLDSLISANDTVQSFAGGTYTTWNSRGLSARGTAAASISFTSGSFAAQGIADMRTCRNNASEGTVGPDVVITDYATLERYENALQPQERYAAPARVGDAAFQVLQFHGMPVLADPNCASGTLYMVSVGGMDGIDLVVLEGADFEFGDWKPSSNQNVMVRPLELTCQLRIKNRRFGSNKMSSITD